jgi:hypothetical protein
MEGSKMIPRCKRCGGPILKDYGELDCLWCGYDQIDEDYSYLIQERNKKYSHKEQRFLIKKY